MVGLGVSAQQPGVGEVKSSLFCAAWCVPGRLRGAHCTGLVCIYSSDSVHGANRKEYISLALLKIPRIAKQDLALFFLSFVVRSSLNLLNLDCIKLINQEALL